MENQTGFDLNAAIEELRGRGLEGDEALMIARWRTGAANEIAEELVKASPARVWRERMFWIALMLLLLFVWGHVVMILVPNARWWNLDLAFALPPACFTAILSRGWVTRRPKWLDAILASRGKFLIAAAIVESILLSLRLNVQFSGLFSKVVHNFPHGLQSAGRELGLINLFFVNSSPDFILIALTAWLMPAQNRRASNPVAGKNIAPGFDPEAAIESWRQELLAQPGIAADDRRELEAHLRDCIAGLRKHGMNDEESFILARHRVGKPRQLAPEFAKADPAKVWRERMFRMAAALLLILVWCHLAAIVWVQTWNFINAHFGGSSPVVESIVYTSLMAVPVAGSMIFLSRGRVPRTPAWMGAILASRARLIVAATVAQSFLFLWRQSMMDSFMLANIIRNFPNGFGPHGYETQVLTVFMIGLTPDFILIALVAWLMPAQKNRAPKPA